MKIKKSHPVQKDEITRGTTLIYIESMPQNTITGENRQSF